MNCADKKLLNKRLCVRHFAKHHHSILLDPKQKRGRYIFPTNQDFSDIDLNFSIKNSQSNSSQTSDKNKSFNYEPLLATKNSEILELKSKIQDLEKENKNLLKQLKQQTSLKYATEIIKKEKDNSTPVGKIFLDLLLNKRHNYSEEEKSFCQNFYAKYPGAFVYLNKLLGNVLPSRRSLLRWQEFKELDLGIIPQVMSHLKSLKQELNECDRDVALIMDEMDIKKGIRYCPSRDKIVGYVHEIKRVPVMAKKALVFMIRGLNNVIGNMVVACFSTEKGIKGDELAVLICFIIKELKAICYRVRLVNQDQSGVNRRAYDLLGATLESPFFYVDEMKIWTVYDFPHLIKSVSYVKGFLCFFFILLSVYNFFILYGRINIILIKNIH